MGSILQLSAKIVNGEDACALMKRVFDYALSSSQTPAQFKAKGHDRFEDSDDDEMSTDSSSSDGTVANEERQLLQRTKEDSTSDLVGMSQRPKTISRTNTPIFDADIALSDKEMHDLHMIDIESQIDNFYVDALKTKFFGLGFSLGMSFQMFLVSILLMIVAYSQESGPLKELSHEYYPVFRCIFFIAVFFSLYGCSLFVWRRSKIEYRSVMRVSKFHTYHYVLRGANSVAYIVFICFMLYILTLTGGLEGFVHVDPNIKHIFPMLAFAIPALLFFCPYDTWTKLCFGVTSRGYTQRIGMLRQLTAVLWSPFTEVTFMRTFMADILCSMPRIFTDLQYTLCIYMTGRYWDKQNEWQEESHMHAYDTCGAGSTTYVWLQNLFSFCPFYIRFMQSLRSWVDSGDSKHVYNALKYALSLSVTGLALAHKKFPSNMYLEPTWFRISTITTLYCFYWDVYMDWGLGCLDSRHTFLRDELYFSPSTYYTAIVLDLLMRLGWAILISPGQSYVEQHTILLLGCVELFRRFMWSIFRVEWEYIKIKSTSKK